MVRFSNAYQPIPRRLTRQPISQLELRYHLLRVRPTAKPLVYLTPDVGCVSRVLFVLNILHLTLSVTAVSHIVLLTCVWSEYHLFGLARGRGQRCELYHHIHHPVRPQLPGHLSRFSDHHTIGLSQHHSHSRLAVPARATGSEPDSRQSRLRRSAAFLDEPLRRHSKLHSISRSDH